MDPHYQIPYGRQNIDEHDIEAVINALKAPFLTQGPKVQEFENAFAEYVGAQYAVAVNNATAGLHLACRALHLQPGERIITTPITFAASANCARYCGGEVWLADIDRHTYNMSLEATRKLIESKPRGFFRGLIPVAFGGLPVNLEPFRQLADEHGLWIIEDASHAPGASYTDSGGRKIRCGDGIFSDCSVFSFHPVKHIACGEGGMVTTNSRETYEKLTLLRSHGITKNNMEADHGGWYYEMQDLGYNYRLTDIQCALGISQLAKNDEGLKKRRLIAARYRNELAGIYNTQAAPEGLNHAFHLFIIESDRRKELYDYLRSNGIYSQVHYIPVHYLPYYKKIGYGDADLKHAEDYYSKCLSIPMFPALGTAEQDYVIEKLLLFNE